MSRLETALAHAARGWPTFPLEPGGKRPAGRLVPHGLKEASTDPAQIEAWWRREPEANIGLVTGVCFDVLDIDGPDALTALDTQGGMRLADDPADDPVVTGPTVATPRGWHCFVEPTGMSNTVNVGGLQGVDWRGAGGYVVGPGSVREDATPWRWYAGADDPLYGADAPIRVAPAWLMLLLHRRDRPVAPGHLTALPGNGEPPADRYARSALEQELGRLVMAQQGERNHQLNRSAHALGQLIGGGVLDRELVVRRLWETAERVGLTGLEVERTILSGLKAGMAAPRRPRAS